MATAGEIATTLAPRYFDAPAAVGCRAAATFARVGQLNDAAAAV